MTEHEKNSVVEDKGTLIRSNELIQAKYSATLIENKLMVWALKSAKIDEHGRPIATMTTPEVRELTGAKGGGIYKSLSKAARSMIGLNICMEDKAKRSFQYISLIHKAEYENGIFKVTFTPEAKDYLYDLKNNFTGMSLSLLFSFKSNHSFRLYEILKTEYYKIPSDNSPIYLEYDLADLKLQLNCININESKVQEELQKENPDFDRAVNQLALEKKFTEWYEFRRKVLEVAIKEVNKKSDIYVEYEAIKGGRGGKVKKIRFIMQKNVHQNKIIYPADNGLKGVDILDYNGDVIQVNSEEMERSELISKVIALIDVTEITEKQAAILLKAAENDLHKIEAAYELSKKQQHIKNFIGWMKKAIENDFEESVEIVKGSSEVAQEARAVKDSAQSNKESLAELTWNKVQNNPRFADFRKYIEEEQNMDYFVFDLTYDFTEKIAFYGEWARKSLV